MNKLYKDIQKRQEVARLIALKKLNIISKEEDEQLSNLLNSDDSLKILYDNLNNEDLLYNEKYSKNTNSKKITIINRNMFYYAAVVLIAVFSTIFLFNNYNNDDIYQKKNIIVPIKNNKALLVIGNGMEIPIDSISTISNLKDIIDINKKSNRLEYSNKELARKEEDNYIYHSIKVPKYGEYAIKLSDNSQILLNSETTLKYPIKFNNKLREVYLKGKEAYFNVKHIDSIPFIVHTSNGDIRVLGTSFNVKLNKKTNSTETTLVEGSVKVSIGNKEIKIKAGEKAIVNSKGIKVVEVDTDVSTAWMRNLFYFKNERLENIAEELSNWYGVSINFRNNELKDRLFTVQFKKYESIDKIISIMEKTGTIKFNKYGIDFIISKN